MTTRTRNWFAVNKNSGTYKNVFAATKATVKGIDSGTDLLLDGLEATSQVVADATMAVADGVTAPIERTEPTPAPAPVAA